MLFGPVMLMFYGAESDSDSDLSLDDASYGSSESDEERRHRRERRHDNGRAPEASWPKGKTARILRPC